MPTRHANDPQDATLIETLTDRVEQRLAGWYGQASSLQTRTPQIRCYTNSFLLRYAVANSAGEKAVLLKIRRHPKMSSLTRATQTRELHTNIPEEYETLQHVYDRIGSEHPGFAAIRPLAYFDEYFAIVMEEFPARSFRQLLQNRRNAIDTHDHLAVVRAIAERAGQLLRFFHEHVYSTAQSPYSAADILADAETYALRLHEYSRGRIKSSTILDQLGQKLSDKCIRSIPYTSAHQDLTCDNVLYSNEGKVCLVDIKVKPAPIYSDLGLLLIHPETFRDQIFRGGRYFSQQYLQNYRDSILNGYFAAASVDRFLVHIYAAIRVLDKWAMHQELFQKYKGVKRVFTRPLLPFVTAYFQRVWNSHLRMAV
jgi:serine/threonine protein kinase